MHKEAKRFQKKGCPMSNELGVIFNNQMVNFKDVCHFEKDNLDII